MLPNLITVRILAQLLISFTDNLHLSCYAIMNHVTDNCVVKLAILGITSNGVITIDNRS